MAYVMKELRDRVLIPLAIPLAAAVVIVIVVLNFSRILLAVEERGGELFATTIAIIVASGVLLGASWISARGEQRSGGNIGALIVSGLLLVTAGAVGAEAIQEEHDKELAEEHAEDVGPPDLSVTAGPGFKFTPPAAEAPVGKVVIEYVNADTQAHTFVIDGVPGFKLEVGAKGEKAKKEAKLEAGQFTYFCDIPGHRQGGMVGTLTVAEGAGGGGGEGGAEVVAEPTLTFEPADITAPAGPVELTLRNDDRQLHTLVVEGQPKFTKLEVAAKDETASGTLDVGPGTYVFFCDVPGHRAAGM
ncbi:MAG: cupredoxin domain-containing protein, partial [Acidimicrobiia bacterium]